MEKFIEEKVAMIKDDFGLDQIKEECWIYILREYTGMMRLDSMIYASMTLYAEIIKRSGI